MVLLGARANDTTWVLNLVVLQGEFLEPSFRNCTVKNPSVLQARVMDF